MGEDNLKVALNTYIKNEPRGKVILGISGREKITFRNIYLEAIYTINTKSPIHQTYITKKKTLLSTISTEKMHPFPSDHLIPCPSHIQIWKMDIKSPGNCRNSKPKYIDLGEEGIHAFINKRQYIYCTVKGQFLNPTCPCIKIMNIKDQTEAKICQLGKINPAEWKGQYYYPNLYFKYSNFPIVHFYNDTQCINTDIENLGGLSRYDMNHHPPDAMYSSENCFLRFYEKKLEIKWPEQEEVKVYKSQKNLCVSEIEELSRKLFLFGDRKSDSLYAFSLCDHKFFYLTQGGIDIYISK